MSITQDTQRPLTESFPVTTQLLATSDQAFGKPMTPQLRATSDQAAILEPLTQPIVGSQSFLLKHMVPKAVFPHRLPQIFLKKPRFPQFSFLVSQNCFSTSVPKAETCIETICFHILPRSDLLTSAKVWASTQTLFAHHSHRKRFGSCTGCFASRLCKRSGRISW